MSEKGYLFEIQRLSTEDGPGIRTTVFFKGCPLKCVWCHNPESIDTQLSIQWFDKRCIGCRTCEKICRTHAISFSSEKKGLQLDRTLCNYCNQCITECPSNALQGAGKWWTVDELYYEINKDRAFFEKSQGGITLSGGEPTMQAKFCKEFSEKCHQNGLHVALDTCGLTSWSTLVSILPNIDLILLDLKEMDPERHKQFTTVSNDIILANAQKLAEYSEKNKNYPQIWIRTPIIPTYNDTNSNIHAIAQFIQKHMRKQVKRWDLLAFNNLASGKYERLDLKWPLKDLPLISKVRMEELSQIARSECKEIVHWSGLTKKENIST